MYLLQTYSLKHKQLHGVFSFLPSILDLDLICVRLLIAGVVLMTWSLAIGSFHWVQDLSSVDTPKLVTAAVWLAYLLALLLRLGRRLVSQRLAWTCLALFVAALLSLGPVNASRHSVTPAAEAPGHPHMSTPTLFLIGASHHTAPLELREQLALAGGKLDALRDALRSLAGLREFTVLNTCNRVEIYGLASHPDTVAALQAALCSLNRIDAGAFARARVELHGRPAIEHLLEVAAGLDSQMVGETEILGQLKDAYAIAQSGGTTGAVLNRVFQKTFQAAKHVRTATAIGQGQISVASVSVDLALKIFGDLAQCRVLVLGAGEIGEKTARAFRSRDAGSITVASRSAEHAAALADALGARAFPFERMPELLGDFDVAVCSTSAPEPIITAAVAAAAMRRRAARPLFLIDLAMPRNVASAAADLANVFLYNLDDLALIARENLALRQAEVARARALLGGKGGGVVAAGRTAAQRNEPWPVSPARGARPCAQPVARVSRPVVRTGSRSVCRRLRRNVRRARLCWPAERPTDERRQVRRAQRSRPT